jgi:hypothetical protein
MRSLFSRHFTGAKTLRLKIDRLLFLIFSTFLIGLDRLVQTFR